MYFSYFRKWGIENRLNFQQHIQVVPSLVKKYCRYIFKPYCKSFKVLFTTTKTTSVPLRQLVVILLS